jgi:hypothetical protein
MHAPLTDALVGLNVLVQVMLTKNAGEVADFQRRAGADVGTVSLLLARMLDVPYLLLYSPMLSPTPQAWIRDARPVHECGALREADTSAAAYDPLAGPILDPHLRALLAFLEEGSGPGDRPVFLGWGSMCFGDRLRMTRLVLRVVEMTGRRAVLQRGWAGLSLGLLAKSPEPADRALLEAVRGRVFELEVAVPHTWLFPRCAAVVHHGGCGTTHTALHAGVPQVGWVIVRRRD